MHLVLIFIIAILAGSTANGSDTILGTAHVSDGVSLRVNNTMVRLCGIEAPEHHEAGYHMSAAYLGFLIEGRRVRCIPVGAGTPCDGRLKLESRNRIFAQCFLGDMDIAAEMVRIGHAHDWQKYSGGYYSRR